MFYYVFFIIITVVIIIVIINYCCYSEEIESNFIFKKVFNSANDFISDQFLLFYFILSSLKNDQGIDYILLFLLVLLLLLVLLIIVVVMKKMSRNYFFKCFNQVFFYVQCIFKINFNLVF